jgi:hypothetical protein
LTFTNLCGGQLRGLSSSLHTSSSSFPSFIPSLSCHSPSLPPIIFTSSGTDALAGGDAAAAPGSVAEGEKIVRAAVKAFGTVHVLINNAGILRELPPSSMSSRLELTIAGDKSFKNMTDDDWDLVTLVHLKGAYSCTKACWSIFRNQKVSLPKVTCV